MMHTGATTPNRCMEPGNDLPETGQQPISVEPGELPQQNVFSEESVTASEDSGYEFKIAVVYQDALAQSWAMQMCRPVRQKFGGENVQNTWHSVHSLSDPEVLLEAAQAALVADVIVIAVHAADEMPPELCAWIDVWLPRRLARMGALAALIGVAGEPAPQVIRTQKYFQAVARRGLLDFLPHERKITAMSGVSSTRQIAEPARVSA
jgi:hypothetical protein